MEKDENKFTTEEVENLRKIIDFSDILKLTDLSGGEFKNWKPIKKSIPLKIDSDTPDINC